MARFKILRSRPTNDRDVVIFDVVYLEGVLAKDSEFVVYDTHHPINCKIVDITAVENGFALRCWMHLGIGWENQFAGAVVDTEAKGRPASFKYVHDEEHQ